MAREGATGEAQRWADLGVFLPVDLAEYIRLSTTVATNALLERKGEKHALITTKGFKVCPSLYRFLQVPPSTPSQTDSRLLRFQDLIRIGNQTRPAIFDLAIKKPEVLYSDVYEVDERVTLVGCVRKPHHFNHRLARRR